MPAFGFQLGVEGEEQYDRAVGGIACGVRFLFPGFVRVFNSVSGVLIRVFNSVSGFLYGGSLIL